MGFFNWAAPMFHRAANRWSDETIAIIASRLRPAVDPGGTVLDVGGGTGALAVRLAHALDANVTLLDPTPEMVNYVPTDSGIEVVIGSAEDMPLHTDSFDSIVVSDAFHHFRDQPSAVMEFARVTRRGGRVLILELDPRGWGIRLLALGEKLLGEPAAFFTPDDLCAFMVARGIEGTCERDQAPAYHFLGEVR